METVKYEVSINWLSSGVRRGSLFENLTHILWFKDHPGQRQWMNETTLVVIQLCDPLSQSSGERWDRKTEYLLGICIYTHICIFIYTYRYTHVCMYMCLDIYMERYKDWQETETETDRLTDRWRDRASVSFNCDILQGHSQSRSAKNSTQN